MALTKWKYSFGDLLSRKLEFPKDANAIIRKKIAVLSCPPLEEKLTKAETGRKHGKIHVFDNRCAPICQIELQSGVVKTFYIVDDPEKTQVYAPLHVVALWSERNILWSFKKQRNGVSEDAENV